MQFTFDYAVPFNDSIQFDVQCNPTNRNNLKQRGIRHASAFRMLQIEAKRRIKLSIRHIRMSKVQHLRCLTWSSK